MLKEFNNNNDELLTIEDKVAMINLDAYLAENEVQLADINQLMDTKLTEGILGGLIGGLTGFALGQSVGKIVARCLGVEKGLLYDLLTSKAIATAIGYELGSAL